MAEFPWVEVAVLFPVSDEDFELVKQMEAEDDVWLREQLATRLFGDD